MNGSFYILEGKLPRLASPAEFIAYTKDIGRKRLALWERVGVRVSTVFLGIDHAFSGGPPVLFETMIFVSDDWKDAEEGIAREAARILSGEDLHEFQERYISWDEAMEGHEHAVKRVKAALGIGEEE